MMFGWPKSSGESCIVDHAPPPLHIYPENRGHDLDGESCWCNPEVRRPCPECELTPNASCGCCQGSGLVSPERGDPGCALLIIHRGVES